jgi:L-2-hydroxyglutarate oxidase LhgO
MYDVAVIGAGIIGTCLARELAKYHLNIVLIEKENDVANGTTKANSAIVHAGYDPEPGSLKGKLNTLGNRMFDRLTADLGVPFKRVGSLAIAFNTQELDLLKNLYARGIVNGVDGLEIINKKRMKELEPKISAEAIAALFAPSAGIVDPYGLTIALAENAVHNGVQVLLNSHVSSIRKTKDIYIIEFGAKTIGAKYVINAAGLYADIIHEMVSKTIFKIIPNKGQYLLLDKAAGDFVNRIIFQCPTPKGKGIVVLPTVHGNLLIGPTAEEAESKEDLSTTVHGIKIIKDQAEKSVPGLPFNQLITTFAGLRAKTPGGDFIIEESPSAKGFINVAAIDSPGLTAAPAIARHVVEILKQIAGPLKEKKDFIPDRKPKKLFIELPEREQSCLIQNNPLYGRIICRCEAITEGEIVDAVHSGFGAMTVDGIKKRVRAGSGRCQGGFCGPKVMAIIARELGIELSQVKKDGINSYILTGPTKGAANSPVDTGLVIPNRARLELVLSEKQERRYDLVVIGGGPAGMAAAIEARKNQVPSILVIEREIELGGILQQCIHSGFGLHIFKQELTGPEYAERFIGELKKYNIAHLLDTMVLNIGSDKKVTAVNPRDGLIKIQAKALILAMGCRERARGAANIQGTRPAGIFTAGTAQRFVNMEGYMVGKKAVVFGSGDIGLIMARRMTLEGAEVIAVIERKPYSEGLTRNLVQCVHDFNIPLCLSHTILEVKGKQRMEGVVIAGVDEHKNPIIDTARFLECDTLLLSRGLIPENELSKSAGVEINPSTGGPVVNESMETSVRGIFACGNVVHVHDLVDWVTAESRKAGLGASRYLLSPPPAEDFTFTIKPGPGVKYAVPQLVRASQLDQNLNIYLRVESDSRQALIKFKADGNTVKTIKKGLLTPGEMITVKLNKNELPQTDFTELIIEITREK